MTIQEKIAELFSGFKCTSINLDEKGSKVTEFAHGYISKEFVREFNLKMDVIVKGT